MKYVIVEDRTEKSKNVSREFEFNTPKEIYDFVLTNAKKDYESTLMFPMKGSRDYAIYVYSKTAVYTIYPSPGDLKFKYTYKEGDFTLTVEDTDPNVLFERVSKYGLFYTDFGGVNVEPFLKVWKIGENTYSSLEVLPTE